MPLSPAVAQTSQAVKIALGRIGDIATLPQVTSRIIGVVDDPRSTARDLHGIIKNDPALATKILKVVNSAFYGLPGQISDLDRAIVLLGLSAVKNIAISASISRLFSSDKLSDSFNARDLWRHSVAVAVATRHLCSAIGRKAFAEEAFLAGLIHDLGMLVARQAFPEKLVEVIGQVSKTGGRFHEVEMDIIGADHQALGAAVALKWKFPRMLQIGLGYHHCVTKLTADQRLLPTILYLADTVCSNERIGFHLTAQDQTYDADMLASVGLTSDDISRLRDDLPEQLEAAEAVLRD